MNLMKEYFENLRFDKNSHLGLGDIRLTLAQQEELIQMFGSFDYKNSSEQLWNLLDDIDTYSDIFKLTSDRPNALLAFYNNALRICTKRFEILKSDGYTLTKNK